MEDDRAPFVLVLDDVHLIEDGRSVTVLERLIDAMPSGSQIALCGRSVPPIHFTRRLLAGDAAELGRAELAFSDAEARAVAGSALAGIDDTLLERLLTMIEGWPAGIHLAVLALQGHPDPSAPCWR